MWLAIATASLTAAIAVRMNTFTPWGTDGAAYIEEADRWKAGELFAPLPIQLWSPWAPPDLCVAPWGFQPGVERGTDVGNYPPGLPMMIAAASRLGGTLAGYLVVPFTAGLLVWCTYLLGSSLGGNWAGLLAAVIVAVSPLTIVMAVQPMSDVPAAALWALCWAMSVRPGLGASAASGAAAALAILVRPNLAPLVIVPSCLLMFADQSTYLTKRRRWAPVAVFLAVASVGPLVFGWSNDAMYGSPFRSGYGSIAGFYSLAYIPTNLKTYPELLMAVHTPLIFLGLLATTLLWWTPIRSRVGRRETHIALSAAVLAVVNWLLYIAYLPLPDPTILRFILPAAAAFSVLFAGTVAHLYRALAAVSRPAAVLCVLVLAAVVIVWPLQFAKYAVILEEEQVQLRLAGPYLQGALPANAAILTGRQSAGLAHFTKRLIVRVDCLGQTALDGVIAEIARHGYHPVIVLESDAEAVWFRAHFASSPLHALDWPPRAQVLDRIRYWDPADRDAYARGVRWATDVLRLN